MSKIFEILKKGNLEEISNYLDNINIPEINVKNSDGDTPLTIALKYCRSDAILNRILDLNPKINVKGQWGMDAINVCIN